MPLSFSDGNFARRELLDGCIYIIGRLPESLILAPREFARLWCLHPPERPEILIHGRRVRTPRWQQVYGMDYHFTGSRHPALTIPLDFRPWLDWGREAIDSRLNGVVVNWYDAALGHYIGPHRDSTRNMVVGSPIIMISLGQTRTLMLRRWKGREKDASSVGHGAVVVIPYETNLRWTHEIKRPSLEEREPDQIFSSHRISITLRAFYSS